MNGPRWMLFGVSTVLTAALLLVVVTQDHSGWWLLLVVVLGLPFELLVLVGAYRRKLSSIRPSRELDITDHVPPELLRDLGHDV